MPFFFLLPSLLSLCCSYWGMKLWLTLASFLLLQDKISHWNNDLQSLLVWRTHRIIGKKYFSSLSILLKSFSWKPTFLKCSLAIQANPKLWWNKVIFATRIVQCSQVLLINLGYPSAPNEFLSLCAFWWYSCEHAP